MFPFLIALFDFNPRQRSVTAAIKLLIKLYTQSGIEINYFVAKLL